MTATKKLPAKQQRFIEEYLIDLNATQAMIRAGYSSKTANEQGSRLLANVNIQEELAKGKQKQAEKADVDAQYVLSNLKIIAERCMQQEEVQQFDYITKELIGTGEYKFDSSGATKALELLGKHLKLFTDKKEVKIDGDIVVRVDLTDE